MITIVCFCASHTRGPNGIQRAVIKREMPSSWSASDAEERRPRARGKKHKKKSTHQRNKVRRYVSADSE